MVATTKFLKPKFKSRNPKMISSKTTDGTDESEITCFCHVTFVFRDATAVKFWANTTPILKTVVLIMADS